MVCCMKAWKSREDILDLGFFKWKAAKAGFKIVKDQDSEEYIYFNEKQWAGIETIEGNEILNGYLLQRAIEGVMVDYDRKVTKIEYIFNHGWTWQTYQHAFPDFYITADQAKEAALKYIKGHEDACL